MSRLEMLTPETMTPEQRKVHDDIVSGPRGKMTLPMNAWLRSPAFADGAQKLGAFVRFDCSLEPRHIELTILITVRQWVAQPAWYSHVQHAKKAGLDDAIVEAIADRKRPTFKKADEEALYDLCTELWETREASDKTYAAAVKHFGEKGVMEIIGLSGYYTITGLTLKTFNVPMQEGVEPPLKD
ncbi:MAG: carboxymuconolactone decarboxylase family protein [Rhodospirillales bacterium]